jgi:hypothetical protein
VIGNPSKVRLSAVGKVLCIERVVHRVGTMRSQRQRDSMIGGIEEVGECVRIARPGPDFTDPVGRRVIIGVNGISRRAGGNIKC